MGLLNTIFNKIKSATRKRFILNKETKSIQVLLNTSDEQYFTLSFDTLNVRTPNDPKIFKNYVIDASNQSLGNLYIELIQLHSSHEWNGSAGSNFDMYIKKEFHTSNFEFIKSFENNFCKFTKYLVDDKYEIALIWFSLNNQELFIFDVQGKIYNDLLKIHDIEDTSYFIKNFETGDFKVKSTLIQSNIIEKYIN